jgi:PAS domain S-box-containing protein
MSSDSPSRARVAAIADGMIAARSDTRSGPSDSRDLFLAALDVSADLIYVVDTASGKLLEVNQTTCSALGYTRAELLTMTIGDIQAGSYAAGFQKRLAHLVGIRPRAFTRKSVFRRKDGTTFPVEINARAVELGGKVVMVSVMRDVSESERIERELGLSEERFFTIFRSSPVAMAIGTVTDGRLIDVNDRYVELFGCRRDELIGRTTDERGDWVDPGQRVELIQRIKNGEQIRNIEVRFRRKSGEIGIALFSMEIVRLRGESVLVTMRVDITERKRMEEALRRNEERFALFMQHLPGAVFIKDAQGRYVYSNPICEAAQRVGPGESIGKTDDELFTAESARQFKASDRQVFESGKPFKSVQAAIWHDEVRYWLSSKFLIPDSQGSSPLLGGAGFDITELKRTEEALRQALEERECLERDLHDGIVQEIYAIGLGLEETRRSVAEDPRSAADGIAQAVAGLNAVIRKLRTQIIGSTPQILDGHQLRAELQELARAVDGAHRLRFRLEVDQDAASRLTPEVAKQVLNVVREAMSNSLRHSFGKRGLVSLQPHQGGVRVVVEDDGDGFDPQRAGLFGQGLRNMEARASHLGAHIDISSSSGSGTRITLEIPAKDGARVK